MSSKSRLDRAFKHAKHITFNDSSKFILFSDCHRGDNSFADDFANNRNIYFHALKHYYKEGFQYCELGDGDELWENLSFESILSAHKNVYMLMKQFHDEERLHMIWEIMIWCIEMKVMLRSISIPISTQKLAMTKTYFAI